MAKIRLGFLLVVILLAAGIFGRVPARADTAVPFTTIATGDRSGIFTPTNGVARTLPEFRALWRRHTSGLPRPPDLPRVDFPREMVIVVFAGTVTVPSRIAIVKIVRKTDRIVVLVQMTDVHPGPLGAEPGESTPFHIVRLASSALPVGFAPARMPNLYGPP